ncbi:RipA family octameric membrane protein [Serratia plymuthica]|uniref:RipA family octameric membrane protein n=1 Tax=Serratia plymuthica TaxID=82996 RepID=UPI00390CB184
MENNAKLTEHTFPLESKEYFEHLLGKSLADGEKFTTQDYNKIEEAYNKSHDIRKFEIELYWKRSTYFWTFISVLIAICGVVSAAFLKDGKIGTGLFSFLFCISLVGYVISLHFLITCISGKQWQENWERHIDILEPYFSGNLYKLNLTKDEKRHSISLSNEIIAIIILLSWIIIGTYCTKYIPKDIKQIGLVFFLITTILSIWKSFGRSKNKNIDISFNIRNVKSVKVTSQEKVKIFWGESEMKWTNRIITGLVIALLTLLVLLLIGVVFYNSDNKMEIGSLTDWISAGANIAMACAAVYAASKAKDWLSPKLNERKFKFADEIIDSFCRLQQEAFYLHADVKNIINTDPDIQGDAVSFEKHWNKMFDRETIYRKNTISLRNEMERMELWGLKPKSKDDFEIILSEHLKLAYAIEAALSIGANKTSLRLNNSFEHDRKLSEEYRVLRVSHNKIIKHYSELFID